MSYHEEHVEAIRFAQAISAACDRRKVHVSADLNFSHPSVTRVSLNVYEDAAEAAKAFRLVHDLKVSRLESHPTHVFYDGWSRPGGVVVGGCVSDLAFWAQIEEALAAPVLATSEVRE